MSHRFKRYARRLGSAVTRLVLKRDSEGSALVEMAVVLPVMMLLITGTLSLGVILNNYLILTNAVQTGAMQLAVDAGQSGLDPCNVGATAISGAAPTLTASKIAYTFNFNGTSAGPFTGTTASTCSSDNSDLAAGTTVTVTATYPVALFVWGWTPMTLNLKATTAELAQ